MKKIDFKKGDGLIPAIVQDYQTKKVLMLGYMNQESFKKTSETGKVTFFSRSRQTLWTKGETSGNFLHLKEILLDCDQDTLLVMVRPQGPTCHTGSDTCFNETNESSVYFLEYLQEFINQRRTSMPEGSYTTSLFERGIGRIAQKVGEEAVETVIEALGNDDEAFVNEAADLLYHMLVLFAEKGSSIGEVVKVLRDRHK